jgi:hypothetical protein
MPLPATPLSTPPHFASFAHFCGNALRSLPAFPPDCSFEGCLSTFRAERTSTIEKPPESALRQLTYVAAQRFRRTIVSRRRQAFQPPFTGREPVTQKGELA